MKLRSITVLCFNESYCNLLNKVASIIPSPYLCENKLFNESYYNLLNKVASIIPSPYLCEKINYSIFDKKPTQSPL